MLVLGIETSCDETAAAVVDDRSVRSNVIASQMQVHAEYGGVVPELASRAHAERVLPVVESALREAGVRVEAIEAVAVGHRPGLIGCLLVGLSAAKAIAWARGVPLVGVDHVHAHVFSGLLGTDPSEDRSLFPALGLVVSGGHTSMFLCAGPTRVHRLGGTIDDAVGEAYDKAATMLGLGYPGGPMLDRLAQQPGADAARFELPTSMLGPTSLDFSFSGLKTAVLYTIRGVPTRDGRFERGIGELDDRARRDLAASFQAAVVRTIVRKLERALDQLASGELDAGPTRVRSLLVGGGVSANSALRAALADLATRRGLALRLPAMELCVDNAAMIAGLGCALLIEGRPSDLSLRASPSASV